MKDFAALAEKFIAEVAKCGFTYSISESGAIVRVHKSFPKGDLNEFTKCDMDAPFLLMLVPAGIGSIWGTDGGSVGGHAAVISGNFCLNKSGVQKRFVSELKKRQK